MSIKQARVKAVGQRGRGSKGRIQGRSRGYSKSKPNKQTGSSQKSKSKAKQVMSLNL